MLAWKGMLSDIEPPSENQALSVGIVVRKGDVTVERDRMCNDLVVRLVTGPRVRAMGDESPERRHDGDAHRAPESCNGHRTVSPYLTVSSPPSVPRGAVASRRASGRQSHRGRTAL